MSLTFTAISKFYQFAKVVEFPPIMLTSALQRQTMGSIVKERFNKLGLRNLLTNRWPFSQKIADKKIVVSKEDADLNCLEDFEGKIRVIKKLVADKCHPIHQITNEGKVLLQSEPNDLKSINNTMDKLDRYLLDSFNKLNNASKEAPGIVDGKINSTTRIYTEAAVRSYLTLQYFRRLRKAIDNKDLNVNTFSKVCMVKILDVMLRGTSSERIEMHMQLYGDHFNQEKLQECFYSLYEPEIETCTTLLLANPNIHKHHRKLLPKFTRTYLLDKAELNVKLRCVLAWAGKQQCFV